MAVSLTVAELTAYLRQDAAHGTQIDQAGAAVVQAWYDAAQELPTGTGPAQSWKKQW